MVKVFPVHLLSRVKASEVKDLKTVMLTVMLTACTLLCSLTHQFIHKSGTRHDVTVVHDYMLYSLYLAYILQGCDHSAVRVLICSVKILFVSDRCLMVLVSWVSISFSGFVAMTRLSSASSISSCALMDMLSP